MEIFVILFLGYFLMRSVLFNLLGIIRSLLALTWDKVPAYLTYTNMEISAAIEGVNNYKVDIWYCYNYQEKTYNSKHFAFNYSNGPLASIHKLTLRRAIRKREIYARVNPRDPKQAVIFSGINFFHIVNLFLPIISGPYKNNG